MQDILHLYREAQTAQPAAQPAIVNELAVAIIDLPHGAAVTECSFFADAHALALPRIESIARLNAKAKFWAGCKFNV